MKKIPLTYENVLQAFQQLAAQLTSIGFAGGNVYGVPRGGVFPAALLASIEGNLFKEMGGSAWKLVSDPADANLLIDDLFDSGATMQRLLLEHPSAVGAVLFTKDAAACNRGGVLYGETLAADEWVVFPWEGEEISSAADIPVRLLQYIGEDPKREGLQETPARFLKAWNHWAGGYALSPESVLKTFEDGAENYDEMVLVKDIPVYSHCEHHLAPFFGVAHVGYIPNGKIVGLSKLSRLVDVFSRRLQVQERLTSQIASALEDNLAPKGVGVILECRHLCMESRGIARSGSSTVTSAMRGVLMTKPEARAEFINLIRRSP